MTTTRTNQSSKSGHSTSAWLLGALEVPLSMAVAIWLLTCPALFRQYYPALQISPHTKDAIAIVDWLSTGYRERSLGLAVREGRLGSEELKHYSDVRRVFGHFPEVIAALGAAAALILLASTKTRALISAAQGRALVFWGVLLLGAGGLACWDWPRFFAWVHHPFFGDVSWRLPDDAYSLVLFPASFWRLATTAVLLAPPVGVAVIAGGLRLFQRQRERHATLGPEIGARGSIGPARCR